MARHREVLDVEGRRTIERKNGLEEAGPVVVRGAAAAVEMETKSIKRAKEKQIGEREERERGRERERESCERRGRTKKKEGKE